MDMIPRNDYGERCQFDAYCKLVLYHEAIDYLREMQRRRDRELSFSDLPQMEMALLIWCEKNSSAAVLREKRYNRPAPLYGISSSRNCLPISLPPRRNRDRRDNHGKA